MQRGEPRDVARQDVAQQAAALLEAQGLARRGIGQRTAAAPFDTARLRIGPAGQHGGTSPIAEQAGADQYAGVIIQVHRRTAHFDTHREHVLRLAGAEQRVGQLPVRQRAGTPLADQIEAEHVGAQPQLLEHIAAQAGAQITGAGADDDRVDRRRRNSGALQGAGSGLGGESWRMCRVTLLQRVRVDRKHFVEAVERETAGFDAVVAGQDHFRDRARPCVETVEPGRAVECIPAFTLGVAPRR